MTDQTPTPMDWRTGDGEFYKAMFDYLKHIATMASGSIVVMSVFLEKLFARPALKWTVAVSVCAFFASLLASSVVYTVIALNYPRPGRKISDKEASIVAAGLLATWASFVIGIAAIAVFFVVNWM